MADPNTTVIAEQYADTVVVVGGAAPAALVANPCPQVDLVAVPTEQGVPGAIGPAGPPGPPGQAPIYTAAGTISGEKVLMFAGAGHVVHADPTLPGYVYAGIAMSAAQLGGTVSTLSYGDVSAPFWNWAPNLPVFTASGGDLTQTPPATGRSHLIGWAIDAKTIHLAPDPVIPIQ